MVGDPTLIRIAVRNLLDNALRHGAGPEADATVEVTVAAGAVSVRDRGPGLPAEEPAGREVRRFRAAGREGTGLGLPIAARIAELHGGRLTVQGREGGGSELVIALPAKGPPRRAER